MECHPKKGRDFSRLGLPPMELAENSLNGRRDSGKSKWLYSSIIYKLFATLISLLFGIGAYFLLLRLFQNMDNIHATEIIIVTKINETANVTILKENGIDIFLQLKNSTAHSKVKRKKRNTTRKKRSTKRFDDNYILRARKVIMNHDQLCNDKNHNDVCRDLVMKLKSITENNDEGRMNTEGYENRINTLNITPIVITKRETQQTGGYTKTTPNTHFVFRDDENYGYVNSQHVPSNGHSHAQVLPQLDETCLLARLLKSQGTYRNPHHLPYYHAREAQEGRRKIHPQDVEIFKSFLTPRPNASSTKYYDTVRREAECPLGTVSCENGDNCIMENQWCDGKIDCADVSDELRCSCKFRVDKSRVCDGYFDCPFGEDEMGCYGCKNDMISCEDQDVSSESKCFFKEQRCNNIVDCPNRKDEMDCNMLAPSLHNEPLFAVSTTEGFLHRNFKGNWYAVCENPYIWANDACHRETGLALRPPFIQLVSIDPLHKVNYLNVGPGGMMRQSDSCFNSSAVYVTCPHTLCGIRVLTAAQLIKESDAIESHLYGRNKRYLSKNYPFWYNRNRRSLDNSNYPTNNIGIIKEFRNKRAQSRVVGGKPSQPAAWPWMVAMYRNGMFHCGGVILNHNWVMSAAHCVHKFWEHYFEIQVGMLRRFSFSPQEQNHLVTHIIVNQRYDQIDMKNDLSLLRVSPSIQYSRWVRPICLPSPETAGPEWVRGPSAGTICTAVGWGATKEHGPDPDHMREVEVPIWSHCVHREDKMGREICAGLIEGGKDACQGDSGGPLLCRNPLNLQQWYIAGIVSHGDGCARKDEPGVYTRVSLFVKWIKYHIHSTSLPTIQPKQDCPGFKCTSGIFKCLPEKRMCDKVIDCLDGEDEIKCDDIKSANNIKDNFLLHSTLLGNTNKRLSNSDNEIENKNIITHTITDNLLTSTNTNNIKDPITTTMLSAIETLTTDRPLHQNFGEKLEYLVEDKSQNPPSRLIAEDLHLSDKSTPDFGSASTFEISISRSSENFDNNLYDESVTIHPTSTIISRDTEEITRGDTSIMEAIKSSVTDIIKDEQTQFSTNKVTDIPEDITEQTLFTSLNDDLTTALPPIDKHKNKIQISNITKKQLLKVPNSSDIEINPNLHIDNIDNVTNNDNNSAIQLIKKDISNSNHVKIDGEENNNTEKIEIESNKSQESVSAKNLPEHPKNNDVVNKIKDIIFSKLYPAKPRKRHSFPKEFDCQRIYQTIPYSKRCDSIADCEDGTDELDCTCVDYIIASDDSLLCDGIYDCADREDESDCANCGNDDFLCKQSDICLPSEMVCDGKSDCSDGEDESDCFALSNGREIAYNFDGRPKVNLEGYLTKKHINEWRISCEDNLSTAQQDQAAVDVCRYLGFSSANRYIVKNINIKEENTLKSNEKQKRSFRTEMPVHFAYNMPDDSNDTARHVVIKEPEVIKEHCIPNVTKTCMSLYVFCEQSLDVNVDTHQQVLYRRNSDTEANQMWPWIAKLYVDGDYKCTGILLNLSWVLVSHLCLWDSSLIKNYVTVITGSHKTLNAVKGSYEQVSQVNAKKDLYRSKVTLLHLKESVHYSTMVKPMILPSVVEEKNINKCVAIGQDENNSSLSISLNVESNCSISNKCYKRVTKNNTCPGGIVSSQPWAGIISCHTEQGWYPAASFVDSRGECGLNEKILATEITNLKFELKRIEVQHVNVRTQIDSLEQDIGTGPECGGIRCIRGKCVKMSAVCNGIKDCEDGNDETNESCEKKQLFCKKSPFNRGCECSSNQLKCRNGRCVSKQLFKDGTDDCGDGTDEPWEAKCSDYLARVMPARMCDGIIHCHDKSDEDPIFCKCFSNRSYKCKSSAHNTDYCVAMDVVCDGSPDCPNGDDENTCMALHSPEGTLTGTGQVITRSHGVWHSKCYPKENHTRSELEAICNELGFISGHAKQLPIPDKSFLHPHNNVILDKFHEITLNNKTKVKLRNTQTPLAKSVVDENLNNCFPVFIECL